MEKWIDEIKAAIENSNIVMEGEIGSCSRTCKVISNTFDGMSTLNRHRLVKKVLARHFAEDLHALSIQTYTEEEWGHAGRN